MEYFVYQWGINSCDAIIQTKAAKELLEIIKSVEFDVIVQDITLNVYTDIVFQVAKSKPLTSRLYSLVLGILSVQVIQLFDFTCM